MLSGHIRGGVDMVNGGVRSVAGRTRAWVVPSVDDQLAVSHLSGFSLSGHVCDPPGASARIVEKPSTSYVPTAGAVRKRCRNKSG
jgi:hypothetical protein